MEHHDIIRITVESLREARALIAATRDDDRNALVRELLATRVAGVQDSTDVITYLANTLDATLMTAAALVGIVARLDDRDPADVIMALASMEDALPENES
jgi:hypothetical protein